MNNINIDILKKTPLFSNLSDNELTKIGEIIKQNEYKQGDIIIKEDDLISANTFYIIHQGIIEVIKNYGETEELIITTKERGDFFGEISLIDDQPRSATIRAAGPTSMYEITRKDLNHILYSYPDLMYKMFFGRNYTTVHFTPSRFTVVRTRCGTALTALGFATAA